ncbi:MAG: alpha/beta hydrolase [Rhodospirillaceae bacterium]|nr:alpha/beta hydrolase [Rhodospirillaceae bacterium]
MSTFTERTYTSKDGLKLYYRDYAGPDGAPFTVLCLPGLTRNSRDFEDVAAHLSAHYRVLCADFRGRGKSEYAKDPMTYVPPKYAEDMGRLLDAAGVDEAVFIGTSLGGLVSMISANVMRHRVKAIVMNDVGPDIDPEGIARIRTYLGKPASHTTWEDAARAMMVLNGRIYPDWVFSDWMTMARRAWAQQPDGTIKPDYDPNIAVPFNTQGPVAVDLWPMFRGLNGIPLLVVRGGTSDILSAASLANMHAAVPAMRSVEVPGIGHAPFLMEPAAREAIAAFLNDQPATPRGLVGRIITRIRKRAASVLHLARILKAYRTQKAA